MSGKVPSVGCVKVYMRWGSAGWVGNRKVSEKGGRWGGVSAVAHGERKGGKGISSTRINVTSNSSPSLNCT